MLSQPPLRSPSDPPVRIEQTRAQPQPSETGRDEGETKCAVDHTTIHSDRPPGKRHVDETYIRTRVYWRYLYHAIDSNGDIPDPSPLIISCAL